MADFNARLSRMNPCKDIYVIGNRESESYGSTKEGFESVEADTNTRQRSNGVTSKYRSGEYDKRKNRTENEPENGRMEDVSVLEENLIDKGTTSQRSRMDSGARGVTGRRAQLTTSGQRDSVSQEEKIVKENPAGVNSDKKMLDPENRSSSNRQSRGSIDKNIASGSIKLWTGGKRRPLSVPVGLVNTGNTCYLNSVLQALIHCPFLWSYFGCQMLKVSPPIYCVKNSNRHDLTQAFALLMRVVWERGQRNRKLDGFYNPLVVVRGVIRAVPGFCENGQQDAQEALNYLLNCLHEELSVHVPAEYHPAREVIVQLVKEQAMWKDTYKRTGSGEELRPTRDIDMESTEAEDHDELLFAKNGSRTNSDSGNGHSHGYIPSSDASTKSGDNSSLEGTSATDDDETSGLQRHLREPYLQSVISDSFQTLLVQRIQCHACRYTSLSFEEHFELSLALPSRNQLREIQKLLPSTVEEEIRCKTKYPGSPTGNGSGFWEVMKNIKNIVGIESQPLTLRECLYAFFIPEQLTGDERYHCEKCKSKQDAEKSHSFAHLSDVLCFNLKRFNRNSMGSWSLSSSKNGTRVLYPINNLVLDEFFYESLKDDTEKNPETEMNGLSNLQRGASESSLDETDAKHVYDLYAVIRHNGSINGGHYIAICKNPTNNLWYSYDDECCSEVSERDVQTSDAYLLFYRKRGDVNQAETKEKIDFALEKQKMLVDELLSDHDFRKSREYKPSDLYSTVEDQALAESDIFSYYIPAMWTMKWEILDKPGTCVAPEIVCEHGFVLPLPEHDVDKRLLRISRPVFRAIADVYGTWPALKSLKYCEDCAKKKVDLQKRRSEEIASVRRLNEVGTPKTCILANSWIRQWTSFVECTNQPTSRGNWLGTPPAGPVDNSILLERDGVTPRKNKVNGRDYVMITRELYDYIVSIYSGGPLLLSFSQSLYDLANH